MRALPTAADDDSATPLEDTEESALAIARRIAVTDVSGEMRNEEVMERFVSERSRRERLAKSTVTIEEKLGPAKDLRSRQMQA